MKKIEIYLRKNFSGFHFSLCCIKHADKKEKLSHESFSCHAEILRIIPWSLSRFKSNYELKEFSMFFPLLFHQSSLCHALTKVDKNIICSKLTSRTRADQNKCLPHLACINTTPLLLRKKVNWNDSEIRKKSFPLVGRACRDKSIGI